MGRISYFYPSYVLVASPPGELSLGVVARIAMYQLHSPFKTGDRTVSRTCRPPSLGGDQAQRKCLLPVCQSPA